jgi:acyl-coenzyme A synthetase/AMP-(fatty) acid ligase
MRKQEIFNCASVLLDENAVLRRDKVAIYCGNEQVTYGELLENVNRFANVLGAIGIKPTERVMIHLPDSPMWFYAFLGSIKTGLGQSRQSQLTVVDFEYLLLIAWQAAYHRKGKQARPAKTGTSAIGLCCCGLETYLVNVPNGQ